MKELTHEDWMKNPTPRMMWVWDDGKEQVKVKRKVVYVIKPGCHVFSVLVVITENRYGAYMHCAEIEKQKQRRMTNKELARWLREKPTREFKYNHCDDNCIHSYLYYYESNADKEVDESVVIREEDSDWKEPLVEVEE